MDSRVSELGRLLLVGLSLENWFADQFSMNFGPILSMLKFVSYNRPIFHGICKGFDCICKKRDSSLGDIGVCMEYWSGGPIFHKKNCPSNQYSRGPNFS